MEENRIVNMKENYWVDSTYLLLRLLDGVHKWFWDEEYYSNLSENRRVVILKQLEKSIARINVLDCNIKEALQEQYYKYPNFDTGVALLREVQRIKEPELSKLLETQVLGALAESSSRMIAEMRKEMSRLLKEEYIQYKGYIYPLKAERLCKYNEMLEAVHLAFMTRAVIYCEQKELAAMMEVLRQYSEFIEYVVAEGAKDLLERYRYKEDSVERIWQERVDFRLEWPEEVRAEMI